MQHNTPHSNRTILFSVIALALGMFLLAFASAPLYRIFCKATGFGGTPKITLLASPTIGTRRMTIRFDANTDANLPWHFHPQQREITLKTGENALAFYEAENYSSEPITGMAVYNVTPDQAGRYFNKIHCFCFDEQRLEAGQKALLPVSFFIDPAIEQDPAMNGVQTITLSYSFFRFKK
jgi:cytochrome c oxidase assembly protein subunit 11